MSSEDIDLFFIPIFSYFVFTISPRFALKIRRFHDMNISGWLLIIFLVFIGLLGSMSKDGLVSSGFSLLIFISLCIIDSYPNSNKWGESSKQELLNDIVENKIDKIENNSNDNHAQESELKNNS